MRSLLLPFALIAAGCQPARSTHPSFDDLGVSGEAAFTATGTLTLALDQACIVPNIKQFDEPMLSEDGRCVRPPMFARTPWGALVRGVWTDNSHVRFTADWSKTDVDPLDDGAPARLTRPWTIERARVDPTLEDAQRMLALIGDATDTQLTLVAGGPPPRLEMTALDLAGGALEPGGTTTLTVRVANHGEGDAYRVRVFTRSSLASLHDQVLSFGHLAVGAEKTRTLTVHVPITENAVDSMLVLSFGEGNGFVPHDVSRRVAIRPTVDVPVLAMRCAIVDHDPSRPELDAGEHVDARCSVDDKGPKPASVVVSVAIGRQPPVGSSVKSIAAGGTQVFDVPVVVPRDLPVDAQVEIVVEAAEQHYHRTASASIVGVVHRPKVCMPGQLTRAEYDAKIAELHKALDAGDLSQPELDRYDAELVGCLR